MITLLITLYKRCLGPSKPKEFSLQKWQYFFVAKNRQEKGEGWWNFVELSIIKILREGEEKPSFRRWDSLVPSHQT